MEYRPEPTCGMGPPFDPDDCGHAHRLRLFCGEIVGTSWGSAGPEPAYCEHVDRRFADFLERQWLKRVCCPDPGGAYCKMTTAWHTCFTGYEYEMHDNDQPLPGTAGLSSDQLMNMYFQGRAD
jgi:hypothetical protein